MLEAAEVAPESMGNISDGADVSGQGSSSFLLELLGQAISAGATAVVLSDTDGRGGAGALYEAAIKVKEVLRGRAALLLVDRTDIADVVGADGVLLTERGEWGWLVPNASFEQGKMPQALSYSEQAWLACSLPNDFSLVGEESLIWSTGASSQCSHHRVRTGCMQKVPAPAIMNVERLFAILNYNMLPQFILSRIRPWTHATMMSQRHTL